MPGVLAWWCQPQDEFGAIAAPVTPGNDTHGVPAWATDPALVLGGRRRHVGTADDLLRSVEAFAGMADTTTTDVIRAVYGS